MRSSTFAFTFATLFMISTAFPGAPISREFVRREVVLESGLRVRNLGYQGDGFYQAVYDDAGAADVQFTPLVDLLASLNITESVETRALAAGEVSAAAYPICKGRSTSHLPELTAANIGLAQNANAQNFYAKGAWGWVFVNQELLWFCNFADNYLAYKTIIDMHIAISQKCCEACYGYDRRSNCCGANDLEVGRSYRGDQFCAPGFVGY